jgi:molybdate transport system substrate-binding protein
MTIRVDAIVLAAVVVCACGSIGDRPRMTVSAAASLKDVVGELDAEFLKGANVELTAGTGSSSALRVQIEQGSPTDVFLSADSANPEALAAAGLTDGPPVPFASNRIVIVVSKVARQPIDDAFDLASPGVRIIAAGEAVPISHYAKDAVDRLAGLPDAPAGFAAAVEGNIVSREDDVRAALTKVELGTGDAAFVYATDAIAATEVLTIALPDDAAVQAVYAGVVISRSSVKPEAHRYLTELAGPTGQAILVRHGFLPPP